MKKFIRPRNPLVVRARNRKAGVIKSRKNKLKMKELEKEILEYMEEEDYDF